MPLSRCCFSHPLPSAAGSALLIAAFLRDDRSFLVMVAGTPLFLLTRTPAPRLLAADRSPWWSGRSFLRPLVFGCSHSVMLRSRTPLAGLRCWPCRPRTFFCCLMLTAWPHDCSSPLCPLHYLVATGVLRLLLLRIHIDFVA